MATINQKPVCAKKNAKAVKIIAAVFILVCVIALFLPVNYLAMGAAGFELKSGIFVKAIGSAFDSDASGVLGITTIVSTYGMAVALLATVILAVLALARSKKAACYIKAATFVFTWGVALYSLSVLIITSYLNSIKITVDASTCILAVLGAIFYFCVLWQEHKKASWLLAGQFFLSLLAAGFLFLAMTHNGLIVSDAVRSKATKLLLSLSAVAAMASIALTSVLVLKLNKWTTVVQLINTIAMLALSLCVALLSRIIRMSNYTYVLFSLLAAIVSFVQILVCVYEFYLASKSEDKALDALLAQNFEKEEYIEVIPYNGDAKNAQVAQLVEEAPAKAEAAAEDAEEIADDPEKEALFEGKEDAFIATLSKAEKYEFADLYILKTKGGMAGIPTYEVGGENKAFFSKIFIYLSQYREKISSPLLAKIYDYAQKD